MPNTPVSSSAVPAENLIGRYQRGTSQSSGNTKSCIWNEITPGSNTDVHRSGDPNRQVEHLGTKEDKYTLGWISTSAKK